jgi:hypothetical protein
MPRLRPLRRETEYLAAIARLAARTLRPVR